jgi:protoheme IX farnesyltransferase
MSTTALETLDVIGDDRPLVRAEVPAMPVPTSMRPAIAAPLRADLSLGRKLIDYIELTKPKISVLVLVTVAVAMFVGSWGSPSLWLLLHTLVGTALVAASASAINQRLERATDALMERTAARPLPAGRLGEAEVLAFGGSP